MPELLGYAPISTTEQNADLQRDALTRAGCWKVFTDHVTSTRERRPEPDRLLEQVRPGDTLVVWRLDRLGRSLRHLIDVATDLGQRGVGFRSLTENLDTTTTTARRMYDQRELTVQQIADVLGVGRSSVYRALWREGAVHGPTPRSVPAPDEPTAGRQG